MLGGVILIPTNFSSFLVIFYFIFFSVNLTTISQIFIIITVLGYKHFMLENRNISINMGTEALVAG
jgi:hypothetical protein